MCCRRHKYISLYRLQLEMKKPRTRQNSNVANVQTFKQWQKFESSRSPHMQKLLKSTEQNGDAKIARPDIARPDNPAPCPLHWFRLPSVLCLDVEENDWTVSNYTVQTFSIIIATFPSANTYLCCWRCLLVNNIWLYDCALTGALSCFIERRRTVNGIQDDAMMTTKT